MSNQEAKIRFAFFMGQNSNLNPKELLELMRLAVTYRRIATELTTGYKLKNGDEDVERKLTSMRKRNRIEKRMENLCRISYGALTVSVVIDDREVYIP